MQNYQPPQRFASGKSENHSKSGLICKYCKAIYQNKRWYPYEKLDPKYIGEMKEGVCPACHKTQNHISEGTLTISGDFFKEHKTDILNLIENVAEKETQKDIENRIERIDEEDPNQIIVYTVKGPLALLMGKKLDSTYKNGKLEHTWSDRNKPLRVSWSK